MRPRASRIAATVTLAGLAACSDAAAPGRQGYFEFVLPQTGLVFHWPGNRLPIRYWVARDAGIVAGFVQEGLDVWERQFLYGEYRGVVVADSAQADVLVRVTPGTPPSGTPDADPPVVGACEGVTSFDLDVTDAMAGPFRVTVEWDDRYPSNDIVNCLQRVTIHEIGHTIGLFTHSANDLDLMNGTPRVRAPSPGDRATAEILYHTIPTITPPAVD